MESSDTYRKWTWFGIVSEHYFDGRDSRQDPLCGREGGHCPEGVGYTRRSADFPDRGHQHFESTSFCQERPSQERSPKERSRREH